jgi:hypothetical protein
MRAILWLLAIPFWFIGGFLVAYTAGLRSDFAGIVGVVFATVAAVQPLLASDLLNDCMWALAKAAVIALVCGGIAAGITGQSEGPADAVEHGTFFAGAAVAAARLYRARRRPFSEEAATA